MSVRYAVYLAPPADSAVWTFGSGIIGYDAETGSDVSTPDLPGFDAETWHALTAAPRRYGFHGTLKAPFRLARDCTQESLLDALERFADEHHCFELASLEVREIGPFIALVPAAPSPALLDLASCAVTELEPFRAPLSTAEMERRRPEALSARQRELLESYGYPYVLDEFRFHMTLTGPLDADVLSHACNALADAFNASGGHLPFTVADVALYRQDAPGERFRILARVPLRAV